jgi:acetyltransferase
MRVEDELAERRFLEALAPETRRLRFPRGIDLVFLTRLDYDRQMAFACEWDGHLVGISRYVVNPDGRSCEFGMVVSDDWRHSGVAQLLMDALFRAAHARKLDTMEGLVLSENRDMLDFARALGFEASAEPADPALVRVVKKL